MKQNSPKVPSEPHPLPIPLFHSKPSLFRYFKSQERQSSFVNFNQPLQIQPFTFSATNIGCICTCPHVLIADDDLFQHFYYENLFQRSIKPSDSLKDFRVKMFSSGEDLLERLRAFGPCQCGKLALVILDYSMGIDKLDGVQTAFALRRLGYKGRIILRTSEAKEHISLKYPKFEEIMREKVIDILLDKSKHDETKKIIQSFL